MPPFVLVGGSYFLFRAFRLTAINNLYRVYLPMQYVVQFQQSKGLMRRTQPTHMAVIFDTQNPFSS